MAELVSDVKGVSRAMIQKTLSYRYVVYVVVALAYFFVYFHRTSTAVMAPELTKAFDLAPTALGLFGSMYFYAYALGQLPAGILADRWGARKTMSLFVAIAGLGAILFGLSSTFNLALAGRFLVGLGVGFVYVPAMRLLADWFKKDEFATYSGLLLAVGNAGSLASAAPLVALMAAIGWRNSMIAVGIISLAIAALDYLFIRNKPHEVGGASIPEIEGNVPAGPPPRPVGIGESLGIIAKTYNFWTISVLFFILYGTIMGFQGLWAGPYLMNVYGMTKAEAGKLLMMIPIGMIIGCPLSGVISDKILKSRKKVVFGGTVVYLLTWIPLIWMIDSMSVGFLTVLMFLYGFFGGFFVVMYANLKENVDLQIAGTGTGFLNVFVFVGGAVFQQVMAAMIAKYPVTAAGVIPAAAFKSAFLFCFGALIVGLAVYATQKEKTA
ncbi:MAG: MFS transporter [Syntrophomonadaceae bacterium]|nr:MFS transporter [Syntrophomonadaceae bacterium]